MKIKSLEDAVAILNQYVPKVATYSGDGMTLDRMWPLLEAVGNPQQRLKAIHIAGTSGKTSTAYYIASMLRQSGNKVGLTVSPHVDSITERVQINGKPISDEQFCAELGVFLDIISEIKAEPSYFELIIVFVFWFFERAGVEYAVVETGMGGLLDGTNVLRREDKICVITDIGFDHMHILGNTIKEISTQKAGIIQPGNQVFMYQQSDEIMQQIHMRIDEMNANLYVYDYANLLSKADNLTSLPEFQKRNWLLAEQVTQAVARRDGFTLDIEEHPEKVIVPGRMDTVRLQDNSVLIMDGAHNGQKMETFVNSYQVRYSDQKSVVMLALKQGKEYKAVIDALAPITDLIILTTFSTSQDMPAVSQDTESIREYCTAQNIDVIVINDNKQATDYLLMKKAKIKIITGSFYLLGQVRYWLSKKSVIL